MPRLYEAEDELTMRSVNGITGDFEWDPTEGLGEPTLDPWRDDAWTIARRKSELDRDGEGSLEDAARTTSGDPREPRDPEAGPRGVDVRALGSEFDLSGWMSQVTNGRIPDRLLAPVGNTGLLMQEHAAAAMEAMLAAAKADGVVLTIGNSYRTYAKQVEMRRRYEAGDGALAADPGTSNHGWGLAVDFNITPENHAWLAANAAKFGYSNPFGSHYGALENWHWEYGQSGDHPTFSDPHTPFDEHGHGKRKPKMKPEPAAGDAAGAASRLVDPESNPLALAAYAIYNGEAGVDVIPPAKQSFKGPGGGVKAQLYQGFMDAGRPDLAAMVSTPEFQKWIAQESGWRADATSPANNHGLANDGLFQIWRGHKFNANGQVASMSPYDQAQIVAKYFHLTPADIRRYAQQIQAGEYAGWG